MPQDRKIESRHSETINTKYILHICVSVEKFFFPVVVAAVKKLFTTHFFNKSFRISFV